MTEFGFSEVDSQFSEFDRQQKLFFAGIKSLADAAGTFAGISDRYSYSDGQGFEQVLTVPMDVMLHVWRKDGAQDLAYAQTDRELTEPAFFFDQTAPFPVDCVSVDCSGDEVAIKMRGCALGIPYELAMKASDLPDYQIQACLYPDIVTAE